MAKKRLSDWYDPKNPTQKKCGTCGGTGYDPTGRTWTDKSGNEHVHVCPTCRGFGWNL